MRASQTGEPPAPSTFLLGLDDTDSARGYCTTYLAYRIAVDLRDVLEVLPLPRLVRLNPNIPFKTRGNAAVCLEVRSECPAEAFSRVEEKVSELSDVEGGANSGAVFLSDRKVLPTFRGLYSRTVSGVVNPRRVRRMLSGLGVRSFTLGNGMGLVGASAAIGFGEASDHTYELIAYRKRENWGEPRRIDSSSVVRMDRRTFPHTFNNYDYQKRKVLVAPHGPDPVFAGVRGDSPAAVVSAFEMLEFSERLDGRMVYVSNQHTDAHLDRRQDWKAYSSGWAEGVVVSSEQGQGSHLYITLREGVALRRCAFYEPTGDLRRAAMMLLPGDRVVAYGGVRRGTSRHEKILNVERFDLLSLAAEKQTRTIRLGSYVSSARSNRHLTKPLIRYGAERSRRGPAGAVPWLVAYPTEQQAPA
jgi:tRNA(Ile2)-agmatinylcytidine synthase